MRPPECLDKNPRFCRATGDTSLPSHRFFDAVRHERNNTMPPSLGQRYHVTGRADVVVTHASMEGGRSMEYGEACTPYIHSCSAVCVSLVLGQSLSEIANLRRLCERPDGFISLLVSTMVPWCHGARKKNTPHDARRAVKSQQRWWCVIQGRCIRRPGQ